MLLLQLEPTGYFLIGLCSLLVLLFLARWIFEIGALVRQQRIQTQLLREIALNNGVAQERVKEIFKVSEHNPGKQNSVKADKDGWITP